MIQLARHPHWSIAPGTLETRFPQFLQPSAAHITPQLLHGHDAKSETWAEYVAKLADQKFGLRQVTRDTAVMDIHGMLIPGVDPLYELCCDCYNTERIFTNLATAAQIPGLRILALNFNTPGGSVVALKEASAAIEAFSSYTEATTVGWMPFCASAGIHLAVGCDYLAAPSYGQVGSIGTYIAIPDLTGYWEQMGISWTILRDGKYKAMGHPGKPLTADEMDLLVEKLAQVGTEFKSRVSTQRPGMRDEDMQGQMFTAEDIPALVDTTQFLRLEDLLTEMQGQIPKV